MNGIADALLPLPAEARKSFTFDRGTEFASWRKLRTALGGEAWFCDPSAPWQKGAVEKSNRRIRRYLSLDMNPSSLQTNDLRNVLTKLNATQHKCLGFRTPSEVAVCSGDGGFMGTPVALPESKLVDDIRFAAAKCYDAVSAKQIV